MLKILENGIDSQKIKFDDAFWQEVYEKSGLVSRTKYSTRNAFRKYIADKSKKELLDDLKMTIKDVDKIKKNYQQGKIQKRNVL